MSTSNLETEMEYHLKVARVNYIREHKFHPGRKWAFDFADPTLRWALEVEGGTWSGGRHVRPAGFEEDCQKYNEALLLGWRVYRATARMVKNGQALSFILRELGRE